MPGILLDTHALYWYVTGVQRIAPRALVDIGVAIRDSQLFVSAISAWETSLAAQKPVHRGRLETGGIPPAEWFRDAVSEIQASVISINQRIAYEAAVVAYDTGHRDPADCHLMATARVRRLCLLTRDATILRIADTGYLKAAVC